MQLSDDGADQPDDLTGIRGVVFDVYGTLCRHGTRRSPYKRLLSQRKSEGAYWLRQVLCTPMTLAQTAEALGLALPRDDLEHLHEDLQHETGTVDLFPDVTQTLEVLAAEGYRLGLVSNLALPYAGPARRLLSGLIDVKVWSFEVGFMKPDPEIYRLVANRLDMSPENILFVGDSPACDVQGPIEAGMKARLLDREGRHSHPGSLSRLTDLLEMLSGTAAAE